MPVTPGNSNSKSSLATPSSAGYMSASDKAKLDAITTSSVKAIATAAANTIVQQVTQQIGEPNASNSVIGITKLTVAPSSSGNPLAVGDNDPRVQAATTTQPGVVSMSVNPISSAAAVAVGTNDPRVGPMTTTQLGIGKPDGVTITVASDGTLTSTGGSFNIMSLFEINVIQGGGASVCATAPLNLVGGNASTCTSPCLYVVGGSA